MQSTCSRFSTQLARQPIAPTPPSFRQATQEMTMLGTIIGARDSDTGDSEREVLVQWLPTGM